MSFLRPIRTRRSAHADFYASLLPAMIPVALLGSAVYIALHLAQSHFAHEKFLDEANQRIRALEREVDSLQAQRTSVLPPPERSSRLQ